jgi:hypothetical protein
MQAGHLITVELSLERPDTMTLAVDLPPLE